jgi:hypothetical protein
MADPSPGSGLLRNPRTGREIIRTFLLRAVAGVVLATAVVWICDYAILRLRIATNHQAYGTVTVDSLYAVPQKDQKTQYMAGEPTNQECVHSLFPHMGDSPCWYLSRHTNQQINM